MARIAIGGFQHETNTLFCVDESGRPGAWWKGCPDSGPIVCRETGMSIVR